MQDQKCAPAPIQVPKPSYPPQQDIDDFIFAHDQTSAASSR